MLSLQALSERVGTAAESGTALRLRGGGSKDFYGGLLAGELLDLSGYRGVVDYDPGELCITARCGTPLAEVEALLAANGQMLAFEPPHFGPATFGGAIAAGLSGPRRAQAGAVRDFILGVRIVDGRGQILNFGGRVMKNVAGYDVSRLMVGSLGTLGIVAEATLKLLPRPACEVTLAFELDQAGAIEALNRWAGQALPLSATFWHDDLLQLRLSGAKAAVEAARARLGGAIVDVPDFWENVREHRHPAFKSEVLWRLAVPSAAGPLSLPGEVTLEWNGGQRWLRTDADAETVRSVAREAGGHAVLFRAPESMRCREGVFAPLAPALLAVHRRLKKVFDPRGILNPGRMTAEL
ncbi:MAG: glycolate oxidase subunit GlcE [Betaproteobacteria bacterium]